MSTPSPGPAPTTAPASVVPAPPAPLLILLLLPAPAAAPITAPTPAGGHQGSIRPEPPALVWPVHLPGGQSSAPGHPALAACHHHPAALGHRGRLRHLQAGQEQVARPGRDASMCVFVRKNDGIVSSTQLSRVESSANGMTNLAAVVVLVTGTVIGAVSFYTRLRDVTLSPCEDTPCCPGDEPVPGL